MPAKTTATPTAPPGDTDTTPDAGPRSVEHSPATVTPDPWEVGRDLLRKPFPPEQIGKLPKGPTFLDYVGHADVTNRLLDADPFWSWEPLALTDQGLPRMDEFGGLWIRLQVCGVERLGYGDAAGKKGPNAVKEAIGDALRNAAMRFGVALHLWAKGDREFGVGHDTHDQPASLPRHVQAVWDVIGRLDAEDKASLREWCEQEGVAVSTTMTEEDAALVVERANALSAR